MNYQPGQPLPDKLYFRIGEVSDIVGVKPYVLRYWETEFTDIKPTKSKSGQRLYRKKDVELLLKIKELLYTERFTINGAKQRLKDLAKSDDQDIKENTQSVQQAVPQQSMQASQENTELSVDNGQTDLFKETADLIESSEIVKKTSQPAGQSVASTDKKFLEKMKNDLQWCLTEIRSE